MFSLVSVFICCIGWFCGITVSGQLGETFFFRMKYGLFSYVCTHVLVSQSNRIITLNRLQRALNVMQCAA